MAAPNIVNVTTLTAKTNVLSVITSPSTLVSNPAASGKVYKVNSLIVSNIDGANTANISVDLYRNANSFYLASTIAVAGDSTLVVISKDNMIYLEEGDSIRCLASANDDLQAICSYDEIS